LHQVVLLENKKEEICKSWVTRQRQIRWLCKNPRSM